jgi:rhodanese-related sulfurtransferase
MRAPADRGDMTDDTEFAVEPGAWALAEAADADVETVTVPELAVERDDPDTVVVDVRDIREVWIEGSIPDAEHAPRGMLEFWADPGTEYYKEFFHPDSRYVLYCNEGGRSALAAARLREMGYPDVAHLEGGFTAWQDAARETVDVPQKDYTDR